MFCTTLIFSMNECSTKALQIIWMQFSSSFHWELVSSVCRYLKACRILDRTCPSHCCYYCCCSHAPFCTTDRRPGTITNTGWRYPLLNVISWEKTQHVLMLGETKAERAYELQRVLLLPILATQTPRSERSCRHWRPIKIPALIRTVQLLYHQMAWWLF